MKPAQYYLKNAAKLGWGEDNAKLDTGRVVLTEKHISGKALLDIGCGFGLYVDYFSKKGFSGTGVDFTREFIQSAQKSKQGNFVFAAADNLPFENNSFDTVLLFDILEHGDEEKILKEAIRVTRQRLIIIVPREVDKKLADTGIVFRHYIDKSHLREYTTPDFERLAKEFKLSLKELKETAFIRNKSVFLSLFRGSVFMKKLIREAVFLILREQKYPTEFFAVFDKK